MIGETLFHGEEIELRKDINDEESIIVAAGDDKRVCSTTIFDTLGDEVTYELSLEEGSVGELTGIADKLEGSFDDGEEKIRFNYLPGDE